MYDRKKFLNLVGVIQQKQKIFVAGFQGGQLIKSLEFTADAITKIRT